MNDLKASVSALEPTLGSAQGQEKAQEHWCFLPPLALNGAMQMALDRWLLEQHRQGTWPSVLRFYQWERPAISLGYHQKRWPEQWRSLSYANQPLELVRRPTGGRAVLHQGELTYALITSGLDGKRAEVYEQICQFLIQGWQRLGVALAFGQAGRGYIHNPDCFGTATAADLVTDTGAKLIGSAQLWQAGCLLQHGSMRLTPDAELLQQVFSQVEALPQLSPQLGINEIITALTAAAQDCFGMKLVERHLTPAELAEVAALLSEHQVA